MTRIDESGHFTNGIHVPQPKASTSWAISWMLTLKGNLASVIRWAEGGARVLRIISSWLDELKDILASREVSINFFVTC